MASWKDVAKVISNVAPLLGTILGGPAGGAIGTAVKLVASALGISEEDPTKILEVLQTDPEALLKIKELELKYHEELAKLALEQERLRLSDVASARQREVEVTKATGKRDLNLYILAWVVVGGFFGLCYALMRMPIPEGANDVVFMLFGALAAGFGQVLQYFFGSSKGSADKTQLLVKRS